VRFCEQRPRTVKLVVCEIPASFRGPTIAGSRLYDPVPSVVVLIEIVDDGVLGNGKWCRCFGPNIVGNESAILAD
jgi:hypothetical protein